MSILNLMTLLLPRITSKNFSSHATSLIISPPKKRILKIPKSNSLKQLKPIQLK